MFDHRRFRYFLLWAALVLGILAGASPGNAQLSALEGLPTIVAIPSDSLSLPANGISGMVVLNRAKWFVLSSPPSTRVPRGPYRSEFHRLQDGASSLRGAEDQAWTRGLAFDGSSFWAAGSAPGQEGQLYRLGSDGRLLKTLPLPGFDPAALAWGGNYLYVLDASARQIFRVEIEEGRVSRRMPAAALHPIAMARGDQSFWVADISTGRIYRLAGDNGRPQGVVDISAHYMPGRPLSLAWDRGGLWVIPEDGSQAWRLRFP